MLKIMLFIIKTAGAVL